MSKFDLENIPNQSKNIFSEIGECKNEMSVQIKLKAKPFVQSVPGTVPLVLSPTLKKE